MIRRQPLHIRHTLWLVIALTVASSVLGTSALHGYRLYQHGRRTELDRAQTIAATYAAQVAPLALTGDRTGIATFISELACPQATRLVAVLDINNNTIAARGTTDLIADYKKYKAGQTDTNGISAWPISANPERMRPEFILAATPIRAFGSDEPLGTLVYASTPSGRSALTAEELRNLFLYPMLIAVTGMVLGFLWLKRKVLDPLALLTRQSRNIPGRRRTEPLPVNRRDEIGELARILEHMHNDLDKSQTRAAVLERSISSRVASETQRITRELKKAEKKIWTDPLTQIGNRRILDEKFADIFNAQRESNKDLSLVMMDVDNFKPLNDTLGHKAGDELLRFLGELLPQCLREQDLAVRYGGDEFVLILPSVSTQDAAAIAKRMIALFTQQARLLPVEPKPSISAGIASITQHQPKSAAAILQMADTALYQAKQAGKGRVIIFKAQARATNRQ